MIGTLDQPPRKGATADPNTWGPECGRGIDYAKTGAPVKSGTKAVVRKISTGRKARGMASDSPQIRFEGGGPQAA